MKKAFSSILILAAVIFAVLLGVNFGMRAYYSDTFMANTWINGIYATGKSVEELNSELIAQEELDDLTIQIEENKNLVISAEELGLKPDYNSSLKKQIKTRANYSWINSAKKKTEIALEPDVFFFNSEKLRSVLEDELNRSTIYSKPYGCSVVYSEETGYTLYDGNADRLNVDQAVTILEKSIARGNLEFNLLTSGCFETLKDSDEDKAARALVEQVSDFFGQPLVYDMGAEQIVMDTAYLCRFLACDDKHNLLLDEEGHIYLDDEKIIQWVEELGTLYNTKGQTRDFQATKGETVSVTYVTYGTEIDLAAEKEFLLMALHQKRDGKVEHTPVYLQEGYARGLNDIGDTYIEVDMGNQKLYYYVDGELVIDTDVVTGNIRTKCNTPEGVNFIYNKEMNRTLVGANYRTKVKYWLPVIKAIGIHDASWRDEFGGDIYLTDGSHGCVNTPTEAVSQLYEMVEVGTPVVMFY